ncbi:hypothetical protein GL982_11395 (plasmid) [Spiroplasma citri]|nr:hypothetical protein GL982_11395 [Spiroplasma citri]
MKLENNTANEVLEKLEELVRINGLVGKIKGIITDRGKEFSKFEEMEKITGSNVYYNNYYWENSCCCLIFVW